MKTYSIPILWESYNRFEVQADTLEEAVTKALKVFLSIPDECYIDDSFEIDLIVEEEYPGETFDMNNVLNKV